MPFSFLLFYDGGMKQAKVIFGKTLCAVDRRIYGSFLEHMGRAVYDGVFDNETKTCRSDVIRLVRALGTTVVRYPGGNFVSGYRWEDGVGKRRIPRQEQAWGGTEPNTFGTDEFIAWCARCGVEPVMAVNLGTRGEKEAVDLLSYCNGVDDSRRMANGHVSPYGIRLWCLGNEMDGPWQIGHKDAKTYGALASRTARAMKAADPHIEVVACGSSTRSMSTFGSWEREVLASCYDDIDCLSLHGYWGNFTGEDKEFLASSLDLDASISSVERIVREEKSERKSPHSVHISVDEWNVNYHDRMKSASAEEWKEWFLSSHTFEEFYHHFGPAVARMRAPLHGMVAPPILEDRYTLEDALVVGTLLTTLVRHAESVRVACIAQLVNVIAPIMTDRTHAWKQTIFYPFMHMATYGYGTVMDTSFDCPAYASSLYGTVPVLEGVAIENEDGFVLFVTNRSIDEEMLLEMPEECQEGEHIVLTGPLSAVDDEESQLVAPSTERCSRNVRLPSHSWNVLRYPLSTRSRS